MKKWTVKSFREPRQFYTYSLSRIPSILSIYTHTNSIAYCISSLLKQNTIQTWTLLIISSGTTKIYTWLYAHSVLLYSLSTILYVSNLQPTYLWKDVIIHASIFIVKANLKGNIPMCCWHPKIKIASWNNRKSIKS